MMSKNLIFSDDFSWAEPEENYIFCDQIFFRFGQILLRIFVYYWDE